MQQVLSLSIEDAGRGSDTSIMRLAEKHDLSAYDASYLSLAVVGRVPLATLDKRLATAAHAEAIAVMGPLARST